MKITTFSLVVFIMWLGNVQSLPARPLLAEEQDFWSDDEKTRSARDVNEGELEFLQEPPDKTVLHSTSVLHIDQTSVDEGWVRLHQCYENLDAVPAMQIVFKYRSMEKLQLLSHANIGKAWIDGQSVQLEDVGKQASLCVKARVRIFYQNPDGTFSLMNGPFHRRFLDGFYPYRVTLDIHYPAEILSFIETKPKPQAGFRLSLSAGRIMIHAYFQGILNTETRFRLIKKAEHPPHDSFPAADWAPSPGNIPEYADNGRQVCCKTTVFTKSVAVNR